MIYSISYDLKKPGQDYSDLIKAIKSFNSWAKPCESHWLIDASVDANAIFKKLHMYIDANDRLLIVRFNENDRTGWLTQEVWDWINSHKSQSSSLYR